MCLIVMKKYHTQKRNGLKDAVGFIFFTQETFFSLIFGVEFDPDIL